MPETSIYEKSTSNFANQYVPTDGDGEVTQWLPEHLVADTPPALPQVSEREVIKHYTRLSQENFSIDTGFYPLGSCTMKYNPKVNDWAAMLPGMAQLHPYQPEETVQGALQVMHELSEALCDLTGMTETTLQPAAGAHGELTGILTIRAYHAANGEDQQRRVVLVPDSAHGTNPATATMAGYKVKEIPANENGLVDLQQLREMVDESTAALMLTNPNTIGLFEEDILEIADVVHQVGGQLYYDGANLNAIAGLARPGDMGFDVIHMNLHKTFSTPHGGGGPGCGPVAAKEHLVPFLPKPRVVKESDRYHLKHDYPQSIGRIKGFWGNFGVMVRAYTYITTLGIDGLRQSSQDAILNANYLRHLIREAFPASHLDRPCMHEFVVSGSAVKKMGSSAYGVAKRLLDYGFHAPTIYWPAIVPEALMIEPTETETKETLSQFAAALKQISKEVSEDAEFVNHSPHNLPVGRVDEVKAARHPELTWSS
ncbi:aminomethyl-transferring glycine dehydrogenase subunit GcvPB [Geitlerinema sp. PCC 9228]|jgi:glycine dehydrogenase subunit 2|uniref:aminomethyl-transferring glycine dehydrogenase subunit GcvPB n=1 Tax=Geitlerinema sp. PCC 9228 TaxID=111611 RepID=UPI0008F9B61A|nr:aminomethyl-transferring glycine dehydrogenase subunit GcvPB [Geitlerinema sp. PCC 9228]